MPYVYGQKVTFIEAGTKSEFEGEIVGPILKITGRRGGQNVGPIDPKKPVQVTLGYKNSKGESIEGVGGIEIQDERGQYIVRECYTIRVNYGDGKFADIAGVSPHDTQFSRINKHLFKPVPVAVEKPAEKAKETKEPEKGK